MIIPLAFEVRRTNSEEDFNVDLPLSDIIKHSGDWEAQVYVAVVDSETGRGSTIKLRAVRDVSYVGDAFHSVGTIRMFGERPTPDLREMMKLYANFDYLRALRDNLNEILED